MSCCIRRVLRLVLLTLVSIAAIGAVSAEPGPDFGPEMFVLTVEGAQSFQTTVAVEQGGRYLLVLRNGDEESGRLDSATVELNGATVIGPGEVTSDTRGILRAVDLVSGVNELTLSIEGQPGGFAVLAIGRPDRPPVFITGRLLLPWGRDDGERALALALKNGSPRFPRTFRVVFYGPGGAVTGASERLAIPPRGSLASTVEGLLAEGEFEAGSIEVFFAGPGTARLFGSARQVDLPPGVASDIQPLQPAGVKVFRGPDAPESSPFARRGR